MNNPSRQKLLGLDIGAVSFSSFLPLDFLPWMFWSSTLGLNHFISKKILPLWDAYGMKIYVTTVILPSSIKSEVWPFLRNHHFQKFGPKT